MHPVQLVFDHLTHIVAHAMGEPTETDQACTCCGRPAAEFGGKGYAVIDSYSLHQLHCPACQSFFVGDIDIMGVERLAKGTPISNKFGMFPGVGWIFCLETQQSHLLAPPGVTKKLPASTMQALNVVEVTEAGHLPFILSLDWPYPLLYIKSFGKKTKALIQGLSISPSRQSLICCCDDGIDALNRVMYTIDIDQASSLATELSELPKASVTLFNQVVMGLASGRMSPKTATETLRDNPSVMSLMRQCPVDPHQRLALLRLIRKIQE
ncbi:hypothetical protein D3C87_703140 [compost metagenome]